MFSRRQLPRSLVEQFIKDLDHAVHVKSTAQFLRDDSAQPIGSQAPGRVAEGKQRTSPVPTRAG